MLFNEPEIPEQTRARVRRLSGLDRLPQSVLLTGGSEKLREKCAQELAMAALCRNKTDGSPCGKCPACKKIKAGSHPDVLTLKPEKDKKSVSVDAVRELVLDRLYVAPNEADDKVYIFYAADELSPLIQNALLKTLEEPPPFVMFVFLCEQRDKLLTTVISRMAELPLGDALSAERKNREAELAAIAGAYARALASGSEYALMKATAPLAKNRNLMKKTAERLILYVRDAAAFGSAPAMGGSEEAAAALRQAFTLPQLFEIKDVLERLIAYAGANANENLLQTLFSSLPAQIQNKE